MRATMTLNRIIDEETVNSHIKSTRYKLPEYSKATHIVIGGSGEYLFNKLKSIRPFKGQVIKVLPKDTDGKGSRAFQWKNIKGLSQIKYDTLYIYDALIDTGRTYNSLTTNIKRLFSRKKGNKKSFVTHPVFLFSQAGDLFGGDIPSISIPPRLKLAGCGINYDGRYAELDELYEVRNKKTNNQQPKDEENDKHPRDIRD